jgi:hypothetical protein
MDVMRKIREFPMVPGIIPLPLQTSFSPLPVNSVCQRLNLMKFGNHTLKSFEEIAVGKLSSNTDKPLLQPFLSLPYRKESTTGDRRKRRSTPFPCRGCALREISIQAEYTPTRRGYSHSHRSMRSVLLPGSVPVPSWHCRLYFAAGDRNVDTGGACARPSG